MDDIKTEAVNWIPWPENTPKRYNNTACDMLIGPCACGATHTVEEVAINLLERSAEIRGRLQESAQLAAATSRAQAAEAREAVLTTSATSMKERIAHELSFADVSPEFYRIFQFFNQSLSTPSPVAAALVSMEQAAEYLIDRYHKIEGRGESVNWAFVAPLADAKAALDRARGG